MSVADPVIRERGRLHADIRKLAQAIGRSGTWRVSSIWRPDSPRHSMGIALDACPLTYQRGGYGLPTARLLWRFAKRHVPRPWVSVSEADHVHLQIAPRDAIGFNSRTSGTRLFNPVTKEAMTMNDIMLTDAPVGDVDEGAGDLGFQGGDLSMGDVHAGPQSKAHLANIAGALVRGHRPALQHFQALPAAGKDAVRRVVEHSRARKLITTPYEHASGGATIRATTIGVGRCLSHTEVDSLRAFLYALPFFEPQTFAFAFNAGNWDLDINAALNAAIGAPGLNRAFAGGLITVTAPPLNNIPQVPISVVRTLNSVSPASQVNKTLLNMPDGHRGWGCQFFFLNAAVVSAQARLTLPLLLNTALLGVNTLRVTGLTNLYNVQFAFIQPGDGLINQYISNIQ